jgi:hypothetical protein
MSEELFGDRRKALEDAFFLKQDELAKAKLHDAHQAEDEYKLFAKDHGIEDHALIDQLRKAGVHPPSLSALMLVPLIQVAWADGDLDPKERAAVLKVAKESGVAAGSPGEGLLIGWLDHNPGQALYGLWAEFAQQLVMKLAEPEKAKLRGTLLGNARKVAESAGGFMGIATINASEKKVLENLDLWLT